MRENNKEIIIMWNEIQNFVGFMILQYLSYHFNVFDNFPIVFYTPLYLNINGKAFYNIENTFFYENLTNTNV